MKFSKQTAGLVLIVPAVIVTVLLNRGLPLYDGVGFPDEAYRYVNPPKTSKKTPLGPTIATSNVDFYQGTNQAYITLASQEAGPQVSIQIEPSSIFTTPAITANIKLDIVPHAPDKDIPPNGRIVGNLYRFLPHPDDQSLTFKYSRDRVSYIDLRLPQGLPAGATIDYRSVGAKWQVLDTIRIGNDVYQAVAPGSGDYALVPVSAKAKIESAGRSKSTAVIFLVISFGLVVLIIGLIRLNSKKSK